MRVLLIVLLMFVGCGVDIGNSSSQDEDNDITTIDNSDNSQGGDANGRLCKGVQSIDGTGGFLWKPASDTDGKLVVLFPEEFVDEFLSVSAELPDGGIEEGVYAGKTNGDRQTWKFSKPGGEYAGRLIVDAGTQECEWIVDDPSERQD
jgi:hypothetical protein